MTLAALTAQQWTGLCRALHRGDLENDERFATNAARMANLPELVDALEASLASDTTEAWVERFIAEGVPAGPIHDYRQVFEDPHTIARNMVEEIEHPVEGRIRTLGFPIRMSETPPRVRRAPPLLGEHTSEILDRLKTGKGRLP
jgi:formyl-CoA transferase